MPTSTELRILQERRAKKSGAILVPILESLLECEVIPEDEDDFRFIDMLVRARAIPRKKGVFSPSMLGSCVRQAYFAKRGEKKVLAHNPQTNGYFLKGNFIHFQWQFAMWKAHRAGMLELVTIEAEDETVDFYGNGTRPAVEVRVMDGDFGGTIDVVAKIKQNHIIDFKGINVIDYQRTMKKGAPQQYRKQLVGYAKIASKVLSLELGDCLLISESKGGPVSGAGSPIALHETQVPIPQFEAEVARRLKTLRYYDHKHETPEPECVSTRHMQFQECAFSRHCLHEVQAIQKEREAHARKHAKPATVARSRR